VGRPRLEPRQAEESAAEPERPMSPVALIVIVLFLVGMGALNAIEFGRVD
jgi:hypothetical protein